MSVIKRIGVVCAFTALLMVFTVHSAQADSHIIYVDAHASGANDGTSWTDAYLTLQDGLTAATDGDQIWVAQGVYYPDEGAGQTNNDREATFTLTIGVEIYGGFMGTETEIGTRDPKAHPTVLSGDITQDDPTDDDGILYDSSNIVGDNAYHIVDTSGTDNTTVLSGFIITAGLANGADPHNLGGGIYNDALGSPTLSQLTIVGNGAVAGGAGMASLEGSPTLMDIVFIQNRATAGLSFGGGLLITTATSNLTNIQFAGNIAAFGGGLYTSANDLTVANAIFVGNTAGVEGGGVYAVNGDTSAFINTTFIENATSGDALHIYSLDSTLTIGNSVFGFTSFQDTLINNNSTTTVTYTKIQSDRVSNVNGGSWTDAGAGNIDDTFSSADVIQAPTSGDDDWTTYDDNDYGDLHVITSADTVDVGSNPLLPGGITTDINGNPRIVNARDTPSATVDMGAYEQQAGEQELVVTVADTTNDGTCDDHCSLVEAIYASNRVAGEDTITFDTSLDGTPIDTTFLSSFITDGVRISGNGPSKTIVQASECNPITLPDGCTPSNQSVIVLAIGVNAQHRDVVIEGVTLQHGSGGSIDGGGISVSLANSVTLRDVVITDNLGGSGGISVFQTPLTLTDVSIENNVGEDKAGGLYNEFSDITLTNVAFINNTLTFGSFGAGINNVGGNITINNAVFSANSAENGFGGGIRNDGTVSMTNASFYGNSANFGGGAIENAGTLTIQNSVFWQNMAPSGPEIDTSNSTTVIFTLIDANGVDGTWSENGAGNITDGTNPLFADAANNNLRLQSASPAIDAGSNDLLADDTGDLDNDGNTDETLPYDLDRTARVQMGTVDLGAYEFDTPPDGDPSNVSAFYFAAPHEVEVSWTDEAANEDGYIIERKKDAADDWYEVGTVGADVESFTDDVVTCDQDYVYRVTATNAEGNSATVESNVVSTACNIFTDVPSDQQPPLFEPWTEDFYQAGITEGCNGGEAGVDLAFCPTTEVNRGQMAVFILRALAYPNEYTPTGIDPNPFDDVPSPNLPPVFELWIEDFLSLGITTGCNPDGTLFCPEVAVDRGQMAVFILRALDITPVDDPSNPFIDVPSPNQPPIFEAAIETFYNEGITTGCNGGVEGETLAYCPETTVDRGQMALFILRAFDSIPDPNDP